MSARRTGRIAIGRGRQITAHGPRKGAQARSAAAFGPVHSTIVRAGSSIAVSAWRSRPGSIVAARMASDGPDGEVVILQAEVGERERVGRAAWPQLEHRVLDEVREAGPVRRIVASTGPDPQVDLDEVGGVVR